MSFISEVESSIRVLFDTINAVSMTDPSKGHDHIENWIQHLRSIDQPAIRPIVAELEILRGHIEHNNAAGMAQAFQNLGELTAQSALHHPQLQRRRRQSPRNQPEADCRRRQPAPGSPHARCALSLTST